VPEAEQPATTERPPSEMSPDELRTEVARRTWFHSIDLGNGVRTPGQKDTPSEAQHFQIPADLTGKTVLDIGAYDGFYSFEAERRGAARVVAADSWAWNWPGSDARRNFDLAHEVLHSNVEPVVVSVEELSPERVGGTFDVVLFLGVLYHAPDPIGYLRKVRSVTSGLAIVETVVDLLDVPVPAAAYYPGASFNNDGSNHFGPNQLAVEAMLETAGFGSVETFPPWHTNPTWGVEHLYAGRTERLSRLTRRLRRPAPRSGRMVFYARP
jgi:tRNA (mo5U34)-methyltransferase